jgi:hypothetical protein
MYIKLFTNILEIDIKYTNHTYHILQHYFSASIFIFLSLFLLTYDPCLFVIAKQLL